VSVSLRREREDGSNLLQGLRATLGPKVVDFAREDTRGYWGVVHLGLPLGGG
jgi:hypothetical protein